MHKLIHSLKFTACLPARQVHSKEKTVYCEPLTVNKRQRRFGFTLIEILVVVGIMAVLASAILYSTDNAREKGKDARRKGDLQAIGSALVAYYADKGHYPPTTIVDGTPIDYISDATTFNPDWITDLSGYMKDGKLPKDPLQSGLITQIASAVKNLITNPQNQEAPAKGEVAGAVLPCNTVGSTTTCQYTLDGNGTTSIDDGKYIPEELPPNNFQNNITDNPVGHPFKVADTRNVYMHFTEISIPTGATINNATIKFTPRNDSGVCDDWANSQTGVQTRFFAQKVVDAPSIVSANDYTTYSGSPTSNVVDWNPPTWSAPSNPSPTTDDLTSPNLNGIFSELLDMGWGAGPSAVNIFWKDNGTSILPITLCANGDTGGPGRVAVSYEGEKQGLGTAPILTIEYTTAPPPLLNISASPNPVLNSGDTTQIQWSATNVVPSSCTINPPAGFANTTSGSQPSSPITGSTLFQLNCTGIDGSSPTASVVVTVAPALPPPGSVTPSTGACDTFQKNGYCYRTSANQKVFVLWTKLENANDPELSTNTNASCKESDPDFDTTNPTNTSPFKGLGKPGGTPSSVFNYCIKSPQ